MCCGAAWRSTHACAAARARYKTASSIKPPGKAEFLGKHGEEKVGVLSGQEIELALRALQIASAGQPAGADGDSLDCRMLVSRQPKRILRRTEECVSTRRFW